MSSLVPPRVPLSEVRFVQDYVQLVFQDGTLSVYNEATVCSDGKRFSTGEPGFTDALVQLIGRRPESVRQDPETILKIHFDDGSTFAVLKANPGSTTLEAFQFTHEAGIVVGQNVP